MLINGVAQWEPDDAERIEEQTVGGPAALGGGPSAG